MALRGAAAIAVAALSACSAYQAPAPDVTAAAASPAARDPILLGHAAWCGTNPPSGYCPSGFKR